jgi:hypothetical protein
MGVKPLLFCHVSCVPNFFVHVDSSISINLVRVKQE